MAGDADTDAATVARAGKDAPLGRRHLARSTWSAPCGATIS